MRFTTKILPSRRGNLGILQLNNPKTYHALTLEMIHCFQDVLAQWYGDDTLHAILVKSSQDGLKRPAFCSGGDVKQVYLSSVEETGTHGIGFPGLGTSEFFRSEYSVNYMLATATKPQISIWDGIVMGGGAGITVHGKYRVATENTIFAMPETAIGLFPDVGSMFWMPRLLSEGMAVYLALTGERLKPEDLLYTGLATHYVSSARLQALEEALVVASEKLKPTDMSDNAVAPVLMSFHESTPIDPTQSTLASNREAIEQAFGVLGKPEVGVEDIVSSLEQLGTEFGRSTLQTLDKMSPTAMKVALEGLRRGKMMNSIGDDLRMEFRMAQAFMREGSDYKEGIRAALVDKDHQPKWNPDSLEAVTREMVETYFAPVEYEWDPPSLSSKL